MTATSPSALDDIVEEYRRRGRDLDPATYAPTSPGELFIRQSRERAVLAALRRAGVLPLGGRRVLEVGCGDGQWLADFERWQVPRGNLAGIDLLPERVDDARRRFASPDGGADIRRGSATALPWADGSFDVVAQSMMFSSMPEPELQRAAANEMSRVLAPGGIVLWYDFAVDNPRNPRVRGFSAADLRRLFPGFRLQLSRAVLAPPVARAVAPVSPLLASALEALRVLNAQHVAVLRA
jgi:SAM-dependent methyltransferase